MKIGKINYTTPIKQNYRNNLSGAKTNEQVQIRELSSVCYKPVSFGWSQKEHKSWGAVVDPKTKQTSFKIFAFPDAKEVKVTVIKRNDENQKHTYTLENKGNGIFQTSKKLPKGIAQHGDRYFFEIVKSDGTIERVKDPYSFRQEKLVDESVIYDHSLFEWSDDDWFKTNKNRISRKANKENGLTNIENARIYELNIATFTQDGTCESAVQKLKKIKDMGFNAIELMPLEATYSYNWGYDGVDKFAPSEHRGGPDELKQLINEAHKTGLNVIMDMVPNHLGPDGASLLKTGPYINKKNIFGYSFNYEGDNSKYVRDFMVNAALNWLDNYHCDGLRLDMTKFMDSDYTMKEIAAEVNYHKPDVFLIAEDAREKTSVDEAGNFWHNPDEVHDNRVVNPLLQAESAEGLSEKEHIGAIQNISKFNTSLGRLGYDSEWDFNYFHTLKPAIFGDANLDNLEKASQRSQSRVKYVMSHDEIGNHEGTRLIAKLMVPMLNLEDSMIEQTDKVKRNRQAQFAAEKLAIMFQTGELDEYDTEGILSEKWIKTIDSNFDREILKPLGIRPDSDLSYNLIKEAFNKCFNKQKMALARTYATPGPIMVFQGDESLDLTPFRFFREFESKKEEPELYKEKGYHTGMPAFLESKLDGIKYSFFGKNKMAKFSNLTRDLNRIKEENPALSTGEVVTENTVKHILSKVFATHARDNESDNDIFTVSNFQDASYPKENVDKYYIKFPAGKWVEILNTDDKKYGGNGYINSNQIDSNGNDNMTIRLAGNSTAIFKRID